VAEENGQKTEQPTGKRLSEAHDRGQYAKAPEIQIFATMAAILVVLSFTVEASSKYVAIFTTEIFTQFTRLSLNSETAVSQMASLLITAGIVVGPVILACTLAAVVAGGLQSGFRISYKAVGLNFDKLNIAEGFQRLFSTKIFVNVGLDSLKVIAVGTTFYVGARKLMADPLFSVPIETAYLAYFLRTAATTFFGRLLLAIGVIGAINYFYERFRTNKDLMMTKQEVKDETKGAELDGKIKMAQRRLARRLLQKQMLEAVQTADVVITNPTHYAIALKYERGRDQAPVILAKGENRFAFRIKELAAEHGVPMVENKPVARLLFSIGKVGSAIPSELYQAVAQILAVVYKTHRYYFYRLKSRRLEMAA
jgi:flagellar biosynthesis protein FlhB